MRNAMRTVLNIKMVLLSAFFLHAKGQLKSTKHFSSQDGLCSQSIILDSTGIFFKERGCEGRSTISFGKYTIYKNNDIHFQFLPFSDIKPISKIVKTKIAEPKDSFVVITFYDRFKKPLSFNFGVRVSDTANKVHEMWTDETGQVRINRFMFKYVSLIQLLSIYDEVDGIEVNNAHLNVYFNFPDLFLQYPEIKVERPKKLVLYVKQDGLYYPKAKQASYRLN
jgi:hypothetical protein